MKTIKQRIKAWLKWLLLEPDYKGLPNMENIPPPPPKPQPPKIGPCISTIIELFEMDIKEYKCNSDAVCEGCQYLYTCKYGEKHLKIEYLKKIITNKINNEQKK